MTAPPTTRSNAMHSQWAFLVVQQDLTFAFERYRPMFELDRQRGGIDGFEQPRPELLVHLERRIDDLR